MKLYRFDLETGQPINLFESSGFILSRIIRLSGDTVVNCAYLAPSGKIGYHPATTDQLFLVVQGQGWVCGVDQQQQLPIKAGQAAYWVKDEWHAVGTDTGMTAMLVEGPNFDLSKLPLLG